MCISKAFLYTHIRVFLGDKQNATGLERTKLFCPAMIEKRITEGD